MTTTFFVILLSSWKNEKRDFIAAFDAFKKKNQLAPVIYYAHPTLNYVDVKSAWLFMRLLGCFSFGGFGFGFFVMRGNAIARRFFYKSWEIILKSQRLVDLSFSGNLVRNDGWELLLN